MKILLWIVQIALALLSLSGGAYKAFMVDELVKIPATASLPRSAWIALGVFEMLCGVLLVVPAVIKSMRDLTPIAAAALMLESLGLAAIYARHSLRFAATNPLVWVSAMALMAAFVAYGRSVHGRDAAA